MRRLLLAVVSATALLAAEPAHAQQAVFCTNCDTSVQQLASYARQLLQLQQEITTAQQAIANTLALPGTVYRDITGDVQRIGAIANQANMLTGNTGAMLGNLARTTGYPAGSLAGWQNQLIGESNAISQAMRAAATILQQQQASLKTNATTLANLHSQTLGAGGRQATLQTLAGPVRGGALRIFRYPRSLPRRQRREARNQGADPRWPPGRAAMRDQAGRTILGGVLGHARPARHD